MLFRRTCKEASLLLLTEQDRPLAWNDKIALRTHLWACQACPRFKLQLTVIRNSLSDWRNEILQETTK